MMESLQQVSCRADTHVGADLREPRTVHDNILQPAVGTFYIFVVARCKVTPIMFTFYELRVAVAVLPRARPARAALVVRTGRCWGTGPQPRMI